MDQIQIITNQIIILTLLGLTGFAAGKTGFLPENSHKYISALILKITMPFLIFTTMGNYSFTRETLTNGLYIFILGIAFILIAGLIALGQCKVLRIKEKTKNIYVAQSMFGNVIFMAYPLLKAMYGDIGIVYAIFFNIANDAILWTLGIYLFNRHNTRNWKDNLLHLINPNTLAFLGGIAMIFLKFQFRIEKTYVFTKVWSIFYDAFNGLGHTTIYLSMIFIGLILSSIKVTSVNEMITKLKYFVLSLFKLLIVPFAAILFFKVTKGVFNPFVVRIVVLQLAMPASTIVSALALQYDSDYNAATEGIFVSTILSIFTLPFIVYLLG
ncbi:AEC family transporter [Ruminiclostridium cellulolyticum]|uniref:Auxin Efflux Carrier n=1 Tax=Ruminiclostridium cellulolyticum (strain ATCC 35319 / DSM 5812 / JCM 6584 / H10) TaxID=394503 RepID=B8I4M4_RUMCH|nr:AEC family transporter [Ruminiclostridium cellulolyticum]ACL76528.1 Auxin Efflux Carrier [Ruminiclostridium cellulolyticum H10]